MFTHLQKRYVRHRMNAYINGELPQQSRRFCARMIDTHADLYDDYRRQQQVARHLQEDLPGIGKPTAQQMVSLWAEIQTQMQLEEPLAASRRMRQGGVFSWGYALALSLCLIGVLIPLLVDATPVSAGLPAEQPAPQIAHGLATPSHDATANPQAVALMVETEELGTTSFPNPNFNNTPEPGTPGR